MKKFILRFIACVPFITMAHGFFAQEYRPLVDSNKVWFVYQEGIYPKEIETTIWKFMGDSIREDKKYMKVYFTTDSSMLDWQLRGIIREDSSGKVFYKYLSATEEEQSYDFGAEAGDTLPFIWGTNEEYPIIIKSIDTIILNDNCHRRYHLGDPYSDKIRDTWIEGIGSMEGVMSSNFILATGMIRKLLCYYEFDELVYSNPDFALCYYQVTGIAKDSDEEPDILIVPNPVISCSRFQITNTPKTDFTLEIYDIMGKLLYTGRMDSSNSTLICRSDLSSGIFIYRVKHNQLIVRTGRIIIV